MVARNAVAQRRLVTENRSLRQRLRAQSQQTNEFMGRSPQMRRVFDLISQAAPSRTTILVQGESGTGKELVARAIHANSPRSERPFITVNSGSLPPDLLEWSQRSCEGVRQEPGESHDGPIYNMSPDTLSSW